MKTYPRSSSGQLRLVALLFLASLTICLNTAFGLQTRSPFGIAVQMKKEANPQTLQIAFTVPPDCHIYQERLHFLDNSGNEVVPSLMPAPKMVFDKASKKEKPVYENDFQLELPAEAFLKTPLTIKFQGCTNDQCYFPEIRTFTAVAAGEFHELLDTDSTSEGEVTANPDDTKDWTKELHGFNVAAKQSGYMGAKNFIAFLDRSVSGNDQADDPLGKLGKSSLLLKLIIILVGGFLLNLTPCILPMIPINLAIIGAGRAASSKFSGLRNGLIYGLGMALAYGVLGLVVVLTGAKFGTLNSSIWFNLMIAGIFTILALGMFGVINIDFSNFSSKFGPKGKPSATGFLLQTAMILSMGAIAALLAGACVAPVVIAVVLYSTKEYASGNFAGLLLPFLLGTGMALPWPLAGAGLSFLPKPGRWMNRVKYGFGALILVFGFYYVYLAVDAYRASQDATKLAAAPEGSEVRVKNNPNRDLASALQKAREQGKPVIIDFHASWCKNCSAMDETVFNRKEVKEKLSDFVLVRYAAEAPGKSPASEVLGHFGIVGLPSYVVLTKAD